MLLLSVMTNNRGVLLGDAGLNYYGNHKGDGKKKQRLNKTCVTIAEGNYNSSIHWGREIKLSTLENSFLYRESIY